MMKDRIEGDLESAIGDSEKSRLQSMVLLNLFSIMAGVAFLLWANTSAVWIGAFLLYLLVLILNAAAINRLFRRAPKLAALACVATVLGMVGMVVGNVMDSINVESPENWAGRVLSAVGYFAPLGAGILYARSLLASHGRKADAQERGGWRRIAWGIFKGLVALLVGLLMIFGLKLAFVMVAGRSFYSLEMFLADVSLFLAFSALYLGVGLLSVTRPTGRPAAKSRLILHALAAGTTVCVFALFMLPIALTPLMVRDAEKNFHRAFGYGREPDEFSSVFRKTPFDGMSSLLGVHPDAVRVQNDVVFYQGQSGVDRGVRLLFDAYLPLGNPKQLPGKGSALIRIHGGGWKIGDKGLMNLIQVNKYFAAQGYVVFDIQYGLSTKRSDKMAFLSPPSVRGTFSVDDMVRHIGIFTKFLAQHATEYGANLDSVFFSGGSAGGQLAAAAALGITSGKYPGWFAEKIKVRGLIPFYPGMKMAPGLGVPASAEIDNPALLIDSQSPPCLVFHGTRDTMVNPHISEVFWKAYQAKASSPSAVLWMTLAGHGGDIYFAGNYNLVFLYYMERFMAIYR